MAANQYLALLDQNREDIENRVRDWMTPARFMALAKAIANDRALAECSPQSILQCVLEAADAGVEIGTGARHAVIIPYSGQAQLQIMWQGIVYRLVEAGVVRHMYADLVYEHDHYDMISGTRREFVHKPKIFGDRGRLIGAYAVAVLPDGSTDFEVLEVRDIEAVKKAAIRNAQRRKKDAGLSPAWQFFEGEMVKKSAIRRLSKRLQGRAKEGPALDRLERVFAQGPEGADDIMEREDQNLPGATGKQVRQAKAEEPQDVDLSTGEVVPPPSYDEDGPIGSAVADEILERSKVKGTVFIRVAREMGFPDYTQLPKSRQAEFEKRLQEA